MSTISDKGRYEYKFPAVEQPKPEEKKGSKISKKAKEALPENLPEAPIEGKLPPILKKGGASSKEKKTVRMDENVVHRQLIGKEGRHGRYVKRNKTTRLPLVDESTPVKKSLKEVVQATAARLVDFALWRSPQLPKVQHPIGKRENRALTEKALTEREASSINRSSPSWQEVDLSKLFSAAFSKLEENGTALTINGIVTEMWITARQMLSETVQFTLDELKEIHYSLSNPNLRPDEIKQQKIAETTLLPTLMQELDDIISIEKNKDNTFSVTCSKLSRSEIENYLINKLKSL